MYRQSSCNQDDLDYYRRQAEEAQRELEQQREREYQAREQRRKEQRQTMEEQNRRASRAPYFLPGHVIPKAAFSPRRPIVAIDWNSTLQDQIGEICRLSRDQLTPADFDRWDPPLGQKVGMTEEEFTAWAWGSPLIQWRAPAYPGAAAALARLKRQADIWIVTATCNPALVEPWLKRERIPFDRIIFSQDKGQVEWDQLVDDSPTTLARLSAAGRAVIRRALPWNEHLAIPAFHRWNKMEAVYGKNPRNS